MDEEEEEEEEQLPDRKELVVSTFSRLFPRSFAGVAAVHKHKVLDAGPPQSTGRLHLQAQPHA